MNYPDRNSDQFEAELYDSFTSSSYRDFPQTLRKGMVRYLVYGVPPGGFLSAVLENDLIGAIGKADDNNITKLEVICKWVYNISPCNCWGSRNKVLAYQHSRQHSSAGEPSS